MNRGVPALALLCLAIIGPSMQAQVATPPSPSHWTTVQAGLALGSVSLDRDTLFEGGPHVALSVASTHRVRGSFAVQPELVAAREFSSADCIPGFTVCAPAFNYLGAVVSLVGGFGAPISPQVSSVLVGVGVFRLSPSEFVDEPSAVSPAFQVGADLPMFAGSRALFLLSVRGVLLPSVRGQRIRVVTIGSGVRFW